MSECYACGTPQGADDIGEYVDVDILQDMAAALARGDCPAASALLDIMFRDTPYAGEIGEHIARARASNAAKPKVITHV